MNPNQGQPGRRSRPLRCLSRVKGNFHARFLEGWGDGNVPRATWHAAKNEGQR
jgi:hypothetical protein